MFVGRRRINKRFCSWTIDNLTAWLNTKHDFFSLLTGPRGQFELKAVYKKVVLVVQALSHQKVASSILFMGTIC